MNNCQRCKFYNPEDDDDLGECRRYPPMDACWPGVCASDWCGEFKPRTDDETQSVPQDVVRENGELS